MASKRGRILSRPGRAESDVYFPIDAVVSVVIPLYNGKRIEAAMLGRDSVIGVAAALSGGASKDLAVVQVPGVVMACDSATLKSEALKSETLLSALIENEQRLLAHAHQMVACASSHQTEERLSRWFLRARDLVGSDEMDFTQERIAELLGLYRTYVSTFEKKMKQDGLIDNSRGRFRIVRPDALRKRACECYSRIQSIYESARNAAAPPRAPHAVMPAPAVERD
jgi:CRP-like cAMP-binding protein